ncbi:MAG: helix-turn-helix domain-containing protein [Clostridia bacterium]|nr:helix-turn-helix domain-containing protein [Clostridia bacterium]
MSEDYRLQIPAINGFKANYYFCENQKIIDAHNFPPHLHDYIEIYVLIEGDVSFMVEEKVYKLSVGDVVVSRPNEVHNCILNTASVHKHHCFWFDTNCDFLFGNLLANGNNLISPTNQDKELLGEIYKKLKDSSEKGQTLSQFYLVLQMIDVISRNAKNPIRPFNIPEVLTDILSDLNKRFVEINSLKYFTEKYCISQSTLNRLFKKYLNTSPKLYLETKRLAYSKTLLNEGKTVFQACVLSGFPDYSNYIRLFKKRLNITPKQYQEKLKTQP